MTSSDHPRGQILAIVAGGLVILLLAVGLVIDTGLSWVVRRDTQNAADLASLAGTKVITDHYRDGPLTGADVYAAIESNAIENDCVDSCTWSAQYVTAPAVDGYVGDYEELKLGPVVDGGTIPATAQGVKVEVEQPSETQFMRLIGITDVQVSTSAVALTASLPTIPPGVLLPVAMSPPNAMVAGEIYDITDGLDGPGNFGWLSWNDDNDANTLVESICTPNNPEFTIPPGPGGAIYIPGAPGVMNKQEGRDCLDEYIANGTPILIPIWDGTHPGGGSGAQYRIIGFAAFVLTSRDQPAVKNIQGAFQEYFPLLTVPAGYNPPSSDDHGYFLGLVR